MPFVTDHLLSQLGMYDVAAPDGVDLAIAMPVSDRVTNPRGGLQGGLLATLVDVCAGRAALDRVGPGKTLPTADLHLRFLSAVSEGPAVATARILRQGRSLVIVQVDVHDAGRGVHAATATLAFTILTQRPGQEHPPMTGGSAGAG